MSLNLQNLKATGLRYMITINVNKIMWKCPTWRSGNVNAAEAGFLMAYALSRCEKDVTTAAFDVIDVHIINLNQPLHFSSLMNAYQPMPNNIVRLSSPIMWASQKGYQYDVFINVMDDIVDYTECAEVFEDYKNQMNLPNTK